MIERVMFGPFWSRVLNLSILIEIELANSFWSVRGQSSLHASHPPLSKRSVHVHRHTLYMCVLITQLLLHFFSCVKIIESSQKFQGKSNCTNTYNSFSCFRVQLLLNPRKIRLFIAFSAATVRRIRFRATTVLNIVDSITYDAGRENN